MDKQTRLLVEYNELNTVEFVRGVTGERERERVSKGEVDVKSE